MSGWGQFLAGLGGSGAMTSRQNLWQKNAADVTWRRMKKMFQMELDAENTSYQRAMADLKAAGLNPVLALPQGAGSPHGSAPQANITPGENPVTAGMMAKQISAQTEYINAQKNLADKQAIKTDYEGQITDLVRLKTAEDVHRYIETYGRKYQDTKYGTRGGHVGLLDPIRDQKSQALWEKKDLGWEMAMLNQLFELIDKRYGK